LSEHPEIFDALGAAEVCCLLIGGFGRVPHAEQSTTQEIENSCRQVTRHRP